VLNERHWIGGGASCTIGDNEGLEDAGPAGLREQNAKRGIRAQ